MLSIISAITAGILSLVQLVAMFGPKHCYSCNPNLEHMEKEHRSNSSLPMEEWEECCESSSWGPDTVVYLVAGLVVVALAITSATLACLAGEEEQGTVWTQGGSFNVFY